MALILHSSFSSTKKLHLLSGRTSRQPLLHLSKSSHLHIRNQDPSFEDTATSTSETPSSASTKQASTGLGFGAATESPTLVKKKQKGKREKGSVVRRLPVQKPVFASDNDALQAEEQSQNERAFLLAWTGLGGIILLEGLTLAASGFLPEEWDGVFVNYLYPSFTPTVFLFVAGTVVYGVTKYLQNEKFNSKN